MRRTNGGSARLPVYYTLLGLVLGGAVSAVLVTLILFFGGRTFFCKGSILCVATDEVGNASQIHLSWTGDPSRSFTVVWRTASDDNPRTVAYRELGTEPWLEAHGSSRPVPRNGILATRGTLHEVTVRNLEPDMAYEYRVSSDAGVTPPMSETFRTRTAPPPGPASFSFAFFSDTGLIGRLDGLTTGTAQIMAELAREDLLFLLGGGDYAYANRDGRYDTVTPAVGEWFRQWQPLLSRRPLMAQYGNHEAYLREGLSHWLGRFAHPDGFGDGRAYSFDVGEVHFTAMYAPGQNYVTPDDLLAWLDQDLAAARARGSRWLVVYQHEPIYGQGVSHPANPEVRARIAPILERHRVDLHLSAHDQSYERTFPLTGVPGNPTAASRSMDRYEAGMGVIYAKVSPAGKKSEISGDFSTFTGPQQDFMAVRDDTAHHYAVVSVSEAGELVFKAYAVAGDGSPRKLLDRFTIVAPPAAQAESKSF